MKHGVVELSFQSDNGAFPRGSSNWSEAPASLATLIERNLMQLSQVFRASLVVPTLAIARSPDGLPPKGGTTNAERQFELV